MDRSKKLSVGKHLVEVQNSLSVVKEREIGQGYGWRTITV